MISLKATLKQMVKMVSPVGTVQAFAGSTIPSGWLLCNGQAVSRTTYAKLYSVIGTTYGNGDGLTTFNVPNLQGRFPQGSGTLGSETYTIGDEVDAGLPDIDGGFGCIYGELNLNDATGAFAVEGNHWYKNGFSTTWKNLGVNFKASRYNSIYGNSTTVQPNSLVLNYIICVG